MTQSSQSNYQHAFPYPSVYFCPLEISIINLILARITRMTSSLLSLKLYGLLWTTRSPSISIQSWACCWGDFVCPHLPTAILIPLSLSKVSQPRLYIIKAPCICRAVSFTEARDSLCVLTLQLNYGP